MANIVEPHRERGCTLSRVRPSRAIGTTGVHDTNTNKTNVMSKVFGTQIYREAELEPAKLVE